MCCIAFTFSGSGCSPWGVSECPTYSIEANFRFASLALSNRQRRWRPQSVTASAKLSLQPCSGKSSVMIMTFVSPVSTSCWQCCYSSPADLIPSSILNHLFLPIGVQNAAKSLLSVYSRTCQYSSLASSTDDILACTKPGNISSVVGIW